MGIRTATETYLRLKITKKEKAPKKGKVKILSRKEAETKAEEAVLTADERKGRGFEATILSFITADGLWEHGSTDNKTLRPVMAWFHASPTALKTFMMNLRLGYPASVELGYKSQAVFEWLKSGVPVMSQQLVNVDNAVTLLYTPNLCNIHSTMVAADENIRAVVPTPSWWIDQQIEHLRPSDHEDLAIAIRLFNTDYPRSVSVSYEQHVRFALTGMRTLAYLDRRIARPLITSFGYRYYLFLSGLAKQNVWMLPRIWKQSQTTSVDLFAAFRHKVHNHDSRQIYEHNLWAVGLESAVIVDAAHQTVDELLAQTATIWLQAKGELV